MVKDRWYWEKIIKKFWSKADIKDEYDCWLWKGGIRSDGYGQAYDGYKSITAHVMAWKIVNGNIPKFINNRKTVIRHTCNNKLCVNPSHLGLGTYSDNANDVHRTGKNVALDIDGVKKAIDMRNSGMTYFKIGRLLGVSSGVIMKIDKRRGIYGEIRSMIDYQIV